MGTAAVETPSKHDKKAKKEKKHKSEKKRARDDEDEDVAVEAAAERRPKKSRSEVDENEKRDIHDIESLNGDASVKTIKKKSKKVKEEEAAEAQARHETEEPKSEKKKSKKKKKRDAEEGQAEEGDGAEAVEAEQQEEEQVPESTTKAKKKEKKEKKSKRHSEHAEILETPSKPPKKSSSQRGREADADADAMELDGEEHKTTSGAYAPPDMPAQPQFPFFTQTVSLYEPIYPQGWSQPVTNCQYQHLRHLKNRYVPSLHGVLLDYHNVALGENPGRAGAARTDEDATVLKSLNEYAVGYGWITADVDLFVPSRGAWMEGSVNLQTEGHIGVVCFGKFNASIEARRLPPAWKWVSNEDPEAAGMEETASVFTAAADDHGVTRQIHSTGFWVDGAGEKVRGRIRFRIRNFDVGISGETSYLSLEGTMLDREAERVVVREEAVLAEQRRGKKGGAGEPRVLQRRRAPEFAMTRFAEEEEGEGAEAAQVTTGA